MQVSAGEAGFDEDVLDKIRDVPGVRAAAPVIEASISTGAGNVLLLGVDMLGDRSLRNYDFEESDAAIDDPLVFLAQADSLDDHQALRAKARAARTAAVFPCAPWRATRPSRCAAS